jgi:glycosyltransferase involved in cell wall biosynthesis
MKVALVTNLPPPYRVPIFNRLARHPALDFHAVFCSAREPNRAWDLPPMAFIHHSLRERYLTVHGRYIHHNPDILPLLQRLQPEVVITDGFNPTHLYAFCWARWRRRSHRCAHVAMTDGTDQSERSLTLLHTLARRLVYQRSDAFIAASEGGQRLFRAYGVDLARCTYSWLCIDNAAFAAPAGVARTFDLMFCGRLEPAKDPLFALAVARATARRLQRRVRLLVVGAGSLETGLRDAARASLDTVDMQLHGFASQAELPALYQSTRVFLFPTHGDVWGIVANEACAAGLPVLVTPQAGVAGELVIEGRNGYVRERKVDAWADCALRLLTDDGLWRACSRYGQQRVRRYAFDGAAQGIVDACRIATGATGKTLSPATPLLPAEAAAKYTSQGSRERAPSR